MFRNEIRRQGYVCAACRRQQQALALTLIPQRRLRQSSSTISQCLSSNVRPISNRPSPNESHNRHGQSGSTGGLATARRQHRDYSPAWVPGTNSSQGSSARSAQPSSLWGGAGGVKPPPAASGWGSGVKPGPASSAPGWGPDSTKPTPSNSISTAPGSIQRVSSDLGLLPPSQQAALDRAREAAVARERAKLEVAAAEERAKKETAEAAEQAKKTRAELAAKLEQEKIEAVIKAERMREANEFRRTQTLYDFSRLGPQTTGFGKGSSTGPSLYAGANAIKPVQPAPQATTGMEYPNLRRRQPRMDAFRPPHPRDVPSPEAQQRKIDPAWGQFSTERRNQHGPDDRRGFRDRRNEDKRRHGFEGPGEWGSGYSRRVDMSNNEFQTLTPEDKPAIQKAAPTFTVLSISDSQKTNKPQEITEKEFSDQFQAALDTEVKKYDSSRAETMSVSDWENRSGRRAEGTKQASDTPRRNDSYAGDVDRRDRARDGERRGRDDSYAADAERRDRARDGERRGRDGAVDRSNRQQRGTPQRISPYTQRSRDYEDEDADDIDYDHEAAAAVRAEVARRRREKTERKAAKEAAKAAEPQTKQILLPEFITVFNLAKALGIKPEQFVLDMGELGFENIMHDSVMTGETAALVAAEYGFEPTVDTGDTVDLKPRPPPEDPTSIPPRPPIVTIMGHVDHGKTTMLDWLRKSSIAAGESGGITQHIGAFSVKLSSGKVITFLDTPGHSAFLSMRQRGANVTDIVILVVAADDSVKPQTLEALRHAQNAKVPIIVAINKCDIDGVNVDDVKSDLAKNSIEIEDIGGDVQVVCVSGKTGLGMDDLEENILALSETLDMRAETDGMAEGWILEASVKKIGKVATVLVKRGTLRIGDSIVAGTTWAKIKSLRNEAGVAIEEAPPGTPVEVLGWKDPPNAGDAVIQAPEEGRASRAAEYRQDMADREKAAAQKTEEEQKERDRAEKEALKALKAQQAEESEEAVKEEPEDIGPKQVNFLVKGDVVGSVEAVCAAVMEIGNNEVRPRILQSSAGDITESDVDHAAISKSIILNFNNVIPGNIERMAEDQGVKIKNHSIIYRIIEDVRDTLSEQLPPLLSIKVLGEAEILKVFPINIRGRVYKNVAGVRVRTGQITRNAKYRAMRDGKKVFDGTLESLKQGQKSAMEIKKGLECGMAFEGWQDFEEGDIIQAYEEVREKRYL